MLNRIKFPFFPYHQRYFLILFDKVIVLCNDFTKNKFTIFRVSIYQYFWNVTEIEFKILNLFFTQTNKYQLEFQTQKIDFFLISDYAPEQFWVICPPLPVVYHSLFMSIKSFKKDTNLKIQISFTSFYIHLLLKYVY